MSHYICTITCTPGNTTAGSRFNGPTINGAYWLQDNDTVTFQFDGPGTVTKALLFLVPTPEPSVPGEAAAPFSGSTVADPTFAWIDLTTQRTMLVDAVCGRWNFFMSIIAGKAVYVLPDPELQVGSIPSE